MLNNQDIRSIISGYNRTWYQLYYEELIENSTNQLSFLKCAGKSFYNCAHIFEVIDEDQLSAIENEFESRNIPISLYLDMKLSSKIQNIISFGNYIQNPKENENWWVMTPNNVNYTEETSCSIIIEKIDLRSQKDIAVFLKINSIVNAIPENIITKIHSNIASRKEFDMALYIARDGNIICACGAVLRYRETAYLAEGGVIEQYRRQGIHKQITATRLKHAFDAWKCNKVVMVSTESSGSNYTAISMGFQILFKRTLFNKNL